MIDQIKQQIEPQRQGLLAHEVYKHISSLEDLHRFMELHAFAVWDFMSLLKALQQRLTCVEVPWMPTQDAATRGLINEIVKEEESDVDLEGNFVSHFELYLQAMEKAGATTHLIRQFLERVSRVGLDGALDFALIPEGVREFMSVTFDIIRNGKTHEIASAFTFGREDLIPDMFRKVVAGLGEQHAGKLDVFDYYLNRHIGLDEDHHGPLANQMMLNLCGDDPKKWQEVELSAIRSLEARKVLWDAVMAYSSKVEQA
jgi:hypothetical protein